MAQVISREELVIPRLCRRQTQRVNVHVETPEAYWRIAMFLPFLDGLLTELNTRFSQLNRGAVQGLLLLPPTSASLMTKKSASWRQLTLMIFQKLTRLYPRLHSGRGSGLQSLLLVSCQKSFLQYSMQQIPYSFQISTILNILTIIPVTTATVERGNSALRYVKTDLRSTMVQERLNSLMLLYIHKDIALDYDSVIDSFAAKHPRRLLLQDPLID